MRRWFDSPRNRVVVLALAAWVAVAVLVMVVTVPYVRLSPGPLFDVLGDSEGQPVLGISGARQYPTTGQLDLTTVSERGGPYGQLTLFEAFTGWLRADVNVVPTALLYPPETSPEKAQDEGADEFIDSQEKARIAALEEVGEPVQTRPWIVSVAPDSPASSSLEHGDIVLSVDGRRVDDPKQVARLVQAAGPDATVSLDIRRGMQDSEITLRTAPNPHDPTKGYLGVTVGVMADSPVTVDFHLADVGGPSAGMIFALGIVDKLTPGDLVDGRRIAGTGTMDYDGHVGAIGGIAQKMAAAKAAGVEMFLAPKDNCAEVLAHAPPGLDVVAVDTLSDAVDVLSGSVEPTSCAPVSSAPHVG